MFSDQADVFIGIDPGKSGALARMQGKEIRLYDIPTIASGVGAKCDYDVLEMAKLLRELMEVPEGRSAHVYIEKQQPMPARGGDGEERRKGGQGVFWSGFGYGVWLGIFGALECSYSCASPQTWKKVMLADMPKNVKDASRMKALQMFPQAADQLKRKMDHNRAEALLIAEYARRCLS